MRTLIIALGLTGAIAAHAASYQLNSGPINAAIPDGNTSGIQNTLAGIAGDPGWITNVTVTLRIDGGFDGDLYAYIAHSSGFAVLLNRVGKSDVNTVGYSDPGFNVTLSDAATTDIHLYGGNGGAELTGTFQPDARNVDPKASAATSPRNAFLGSFNNTDPNGSWTLFVADMASGDQSTLVQWQVNVLTAVPEPGVIGLGALGLLTFALGRRWLRRQTK